MTKGGPFAPVEMTKGGTFAPVEMTMGRFAATVEMTRRGAVVGLLPAGEVLGIQESGFSGVCADDGHGVGGGVVVRGSGEGSRGQGIVGL